jgi:hypothetical protein
VFIGISSVMLRVCRVQRMPTEAKMTANAAQAEDQSTVQKRRGNPNWLPGVSANPSGRGYRLPAMVAKIVADLGGESRVTAASLLLIEQACRLKIKAERAKDANSAVRLANASARLLSKVVLKPEPQPLSYAEYLKQREAIP